MFDGWFQSSEAESSAQSSKKDDQTIPGLLRRSSFMARDGVITEKEKEKIKYALLGTNLEQSQDRERYRELRAGQRISRASERVESVEFSE